MRSNKTDKMDVIIEKDNPFEPISPNDHKLAKRRAVLITIFAFLLLISIPLSFIAASMLGRFGAKDISATYGPDDLTSAKQKLGIGFEAVDGSNYNDVLSLAMAEAGEDWDEDTSYSDFIWTYSNYNMLVVEMTAAELQATACEISPLAFWTSQLQFR